MNWTISRRYRWKAVVLFFTLWPTLLGFYQLPRMEHALIGFLISFVMLFFCGLILIFRHKTGYGLIPLIIGLCAGCEFLDYSSMLR